LPLSLYSRPYFLSCITNSVRLISSEIYLEAIHKNRFEKWLNNASAKQLLVQRGIISPLIDQQLKSLEESLEDLKVALYKSMFSTTDEKRIRREIEMVRQKIAENERLKSELFYLTVEGFASRLKYMVNVAGSLYDGQTNKRVFSDDEIREPDFFFIDAVTNQKTKIEPTDKEIREISRTQPWRTTWSLGKPNPFSRSPINLMEYQQSLLVYSNMYDNIRESMDSPSDTIINDDDCCDGWIILQSRRREKELRERQVESTLGKASKAGEVFIPVKNKEDFNRVNSMNDGGNKIVMKQRSNQIKKLGVVKDGDLVDNKIKIQGQQIQQLRERAKGK
jgi:hypothetical protein